MLGLVSGLRLVLRLVLVPGLGSGVHESAPPLSLSPILVRVSWLLGVGLVLRLGLRIKGLVLGR